MLAAAEENGRLLGCCSTRLLARRRRGRWPQLVRDGALGNLYHVTFIHRLQRSRSGIEHQHSSRWFLDKSKSGGGVIMDWGPYDIAALTEVFQPVKMTVSSASLARPVTGADSHGYSVGNGATLFGTAHPASGHRPEVASDL